MSAVCLLYCKNISCLFTNFSTFQLFVDFLCRIFFTNSEYLIARLWLKMRYFLKFSPTVQCHDEEAKLVRQRFSTFFLISLICFGLRPLAKWSLLQFSFFRSACPWTYLASSNNAQWLKFAQNSLTTKAKVSLCCSKIKVLWNSGMSLLEDAHLKAQSASRCGLKSNHHQRSSAP